MQMHGSHQAITNIMRIQPKHQKPAKTKKETSLTISVLV